MNTKDTAAMIVEEIDRAIAYVASDGELLNTASVKSWMNKVRDMAKTLSTPINHGDGWTTFPSVPVTVPTRCVADGAVVVAVRQPRKGDRVVDFSVAPHVIPRVMTASVDWRYGVYPLLSVPPAPVLQVGAYYRLKDSGKIIGPIKAETHVGGVLAILAKAVDATKPLVCWRPPASLKAGSYWWNGFSLSRGNTTAISSEARECIADWTDPPKAGKWSVPGNGELAVWEGK